MRSEIYVYFQSANIIHGVSSETPSQVYKFVSTGLFWFFPRHVGESCDISDDDLELIAHIMRCHQKQGGQKIMWWQIV